MKLRSRRMVVAIAAIVGLLVSVMPLAMAAPQSAQAAPLAAAAPGSITLSVTSDRSVNNGPGFVHKGDAITAYKWIINVDDTGDPGTLTDQGTANCLPATAGAGSSTDPNFADTCKWPSIHNTSGFAPIVAQGDQSDLNTAKAIADLPAGKYLISLTADGFKIGGSHFTVSGGTQQVDAELDPTPLPLSTIRITVFNDNAPVDATYEVDAESGLRGFTAHLSDVTGTVSTDYYGNPLCTVYLHKNRNGSGPMLFDAGNRPIVDTTRSTGQCVSDSNGLILIPNLGPNRLAATITPPAPTAGQTYQWVQTTTLEGGHDHDIWSQEGATGFDTEQTKGAELVPSVQFGFVRSQAISLPRRGTAPTGEVKGVAIAGLPYIGGQGGQQGPGETGFAGAKAGGPIKQPWVALSDLNAGDRQIYVGRGADDGSFDVKNVPDGSYQLSLWDDDQDYILWSFNVTVANGGVTNVGNKMIVGWFAHIYGKIFVDANGNGKLDPGERTVPQFALTVRERDNSLMDQATNTVTTNDSGVYDIHETYPMGKWLVLEAFNTRYKTTGITYKGENEPTATTKLGSAVDINFLPIIGLGGEIDWGVQPYDTGTNGGIVGTVTYDTTRNELNAADAVTEAYQPGIPDVPVRLYVPKPCTVSDPAAIANECRQGKEIVPLQVPDPADATKLIDNPSADRGAFVKGPEIQDAYTSEKWAPPRGCTARMYNGQPLTDQQALPEFGAAANRLCVEAPMMGIAVGPSDATPGAFSQTVNGNYGFSTSKLNLYAPGSPKNPAPNRDLPLYAPLAANGYPEQDLAPNDYIVSVDIPKDPVDGKPMYKITKEEDVNVFDGDTYLPQENFPPATPAAAADPSGPGAKALTPPAQSPSQAAGIISSCVGPLHTVDVTNQAFLAGGGSPYQGYSQPLCTDKLVTVRTGQATAPNFNLFTDVPIPTHFWGLTLNDLGLTLDKRSVNYGEAQGIPFVPVGMYDWQGRLIDTAHTDFNGLYEALEPSTSTYNCPVPAGPCPNMYRFVGNDPGQPGQLNSDYNPRFRTIATNFQAWPGLYTVTDEAPTQVASTVLAPDSTVANPTVCDPSPQQPQLLASDHPYLRTSSHSQVVTVRGLGFGATKGTGKLTLAGTAMATTSWTDTQVTFTVPAGFHTGRAALAITGANGLSSVNGLTISVLDPANPAAAGETPTNPKLAEVGPGKQFATIQAAVEQARPTPAVRGTRGRPGTPAKPYWLIAVWPNAQTSANPLGEYTENVIVHHQVQIQGVGPGGFDSAKTYVAGSIIDGSGFNPDDTSGTNWIALLGSLRYSGNPAVPDSAAVTVLDDPNLAGVVPTTYPTTLDGFAITGGSESNVATNVNAITGGVKTPYGATGALVTQGGGIYVHNNVSGLTITDNILRGNSGAYGGAVRVGTPYTGDNHNYGLVLARNQIRDNGGTNLAGAIGLFTGSDGYLVDSNAICGNFSAEYGGALSAFGYNAHSSGAVGKITRNKIWFNSSYDEGGAVMVAGELPSNPAALSEGSGPVTIDANVIQSNLASDDGGGIRLLQVSGSHVTRTAPGTITISNNTIANNVSAHEGGGLALDDAAFVNVVNNTIAKNLTTATAVTSDGTPAPAGLSTAANSGPLRARLSNTSLFPGSSLLATTLFSKPTLLNDVFSDNRAGNFSGGYVYGIGGKLPNGSDNTVSNWDMGVVDSPGLLNPVNSVIQTTAGTDGGTNTTVTDNPGFVSPFDVTVNVLASRMYPAFRQSVIVTEILPLNLMGDYHLAGTSAAAYGRGAAATTVRWGTGGAGWTYTVAAASPDIDGQPRPGAGTPKRYDAGSDQLVP